MAHELTPKAGQPYLAPEEVMRRLQNTFRYVDASASRGAASIEQDIAYMVSARQSGTPYTDEEIERLRGVKDKAIDVIVADESQADLAYLSVLIEPDEKLFFGYESGEHEDAARPLLERIAEVLEYEIELV
jgi:hypothetical protein